MNMKNNRRRRESREKIEKACIALLQTKDIGQITVSEICKATGLNRSTFYAQYEDIYALADTLRVRLEGEVAALYGEEQSSQYAKGDWLRLFYHIKDNQLFYKTYFKLGYDTEHLPNIDQLAKAYKVFPAEEMVYHVEFFRAGFNAVVKRWLAGGCAETPEQIAAVFINEYRGRQK